KTLLRKIKKEGLAEACPISITCLYYCYCISLSFFLFSAFSCVLPILSLATLSFSLLSFSIVDSFFVSLLSFPGFILFFTLVKFLLVASAQLIKSISWNDLSSG